MIGDIPVIPCKRNAGSGSEVRKNKEERNGSEGWAGDFECETEQLKGLSEGEFVEE